ncbi:MAG: hypothetical protein ACYTFG_08820, partial [Planctomycetota bacterium]
MIGSLIAAVRIWKATRRYEGGDLPGARALVLSAMEANPRLPMAEQYLGVIALKEGKLAQAEDHLLRAEGQGGDPFIIAQALGALAIVKKRYEEGEKKFLESIDAFPVAFELWYHVGLA